MIITGSFFPRVFWSSTPKKTTWVQVGAFALIQSHLPPARRWNNAVHPQVFNQLSIEPTLSRTTAPQEFIPKRLLILTTATGPYPCETPLRPRSANYPASRLESDRT